MKKNRQRGVFHLCKDLYAVVNIPREMYAHILSLFFSFVKKTATDITADLVGFSNIQENFVGWVVFSVKGWKGQRQVRRKRWCMRFWWTLCKGIFLEGNPSFFVTKDILCLPCGVSLHFFFTLCNSFFFSRKFFYCYPIGQLFTTTRERESPLSLSPFLPLYCQIGFLRHCFMT